MSNITTGPGRLREEYPHSILERTLIAEYLLGKGYLMSDLKGLPKHVTRSLMSEASRFAALRLAEIESKANIQWIIRLPISLN